MKDNIHFSTSVISDDQIKYTQCLITVSYIAISALFLMMLCISISFFFEEYFSLTSQVFAHMGIIIFAGLAKIGYVFRCVGVHGLGYKFF